MTKCPARQATQNGPEVTPLDCTCEAKNRLATWHNGRCDLYQRPRQNGPYPEEKS